MPFSPKIGFAPPGSQVAARHDYVKEVIRHPRFYQLALLFLIFLSALLYMPKPQHYALVDMFSFTKSEDWSTQGCSEVIINQQEILRTTFRGMFGNARKVALIGIPDHSNSVSDLLGISIDLICLTEGDSAIVVGERALLQALGIDVRLLNVVSILLIL